ncbi:MAG: metallophosphoesterase [Dehalococcoidia bacterium]|nr:metallophosphoesterase [Dehalococcoidia bacterium]
MKTLVLADVHSNLEALTAVIEDAISNGPIESVWCLGDVVGYGPDPSACIAVLRSIQALIIAGNHDLGVVGAIPLLDFNEYAAAACQWNGERLSEQEVQFLSGLPMIIEIEGFTLAHGSPRDPAWEYLISPELAIANLSHFTTKYCIVGHSHLPLLFRFRDRRRVKCQMSLLKHGEGVALAGERMIINPGAVGQPRDGDPRAAYAIYDSEEKTITHYRVRYDYQTTQEKIRRAGLPEPLAERLEHGR